MTRLPRAERIAREKILRHLWVGREADFIASQMPQQIPEAWHTLEADLDVEEPKVKVTLYLDASVAKFYRAMGQGYQARINRILGTWAQMKIAGFLRTEATLRERTGRLGREDAQGGGELEARGE